MADNSERFPEQDEQLSIVPMTRDDLDRVVAIERASFPTAWRREAYERELLNANARYLVAKLGGEVVGYAGMWAIMDEAHITTLAVATPYRRRGIGERLLVALLQSAEDAGAGMVTLEVRASNEAARALYERYGFEAVAYMGGYYADTGEEAVVMWLKPLRPAPQVRDPERAAQDGPEGPQGCRDGEPSGGEA